MSAAFVAGLVLCAVVLAFQQLGRRRLRRAPADPTPPAAVPAAGLQLVWTRDPISGQRDRQEF